MNIIALEPYYGGSHKAFADGLSKHSRHNWTWLTLPPFKWKWRMRHAAIELAEQTNQLIADSNRFDLIFCSDMLNLAEFKGLVDSTIRELPSVIYFHENQLTYPVRFEKERDLHFPLTNFISCLAADRIWFNSHFHKNDYLDALPRFLKRWPDYQPIEQIATLKAKARVVYPGLDAIEVAKTSAAEEPLHILWAARWEHDKNPDMFFKALETLKAEGRPFRLSVIGESFDDVPEIFGRAKQSFADKIIHWGFLSSREEYIKVLQQADIVVSTAIHEFYGIAVLEAIAAGAYPLLPDRLSYPELLNSMINSSNTTHLYEGSLDSLIARLRPLLANKNQDEFSWEKRCQRSGWTKKLQWENSIAAIDCQLEKMRIGN